MCSSNIAGKFARARLFAALVADARQFLAERLAVAVGARIGVVGGKHAGEDAGGEHGRREARAFFVGPVDDLDRRVGLVAGSCSVRMASSAASTPSTPSNLPPVGWVSRCEPMAIGGRAGFLPGRRANMLPTSSTATVQPSASHCALNQSRTWRSRSVSVSRQMPPFGVAPICAVCISVSQSRCASICRFCIVPGSARVRLRRQDVIGRGRREVIGLVSHLPNSVHWRQFAGRLWLTNSLNSTTN